MPSIVADYRASATIDVEHDQFDRTAGTQLQMPVTVLQQDWGFGGEDFWRAWAPKLDHRTVTCGHFMAEEDPELIAAALRA